MKKIRYSDRKHGRYGVPEITVRYLEGALAISAQVSFESELPGRERILKEQMNGLANWVRDSGGYAGHIKAVYVQGGDAYFLNTTGGEVQMRTCAAAEPKSKAGEIRLAAIVFKMPEEEMKKRIHMLLTDAGCGI